MVKKDWKNLLTEHQVEWVDLGANVAKGNLNIKCPFCGPSDPSHHLGIHLKTGWWGCWRDPNHRGKSPYRLLRALLGWTDREVDAWWQDEPEIGTFAHVVDKLRHATPAPTNPVDTWVQWPAELRPLTNHRTDTLLRRYLVHRGFAESALPELAAAYQIHVATTGGEWEKRICLPLVANGKLRAITGRAIGKVTPRYLTTSGRGIKDYVWQQDDLTERPVVVVTEGPFDALKLDWYGAPYGVRATCIFGSFASERQLAVLQQVTAQVVVSLDRDNFAGSLRLTSALASCGARSSAPPAGDFGDATPTQIAQWCLQWRGGAYGGR